MPKIEVRPVESTADQEDFIYLPWQLYRDDPNWVPPILMSHRGLLGYAPEPFYERNEIQTFLATRDDIPCGRIAAIVNRGHLERYRDELGFVGFFESIDDPEVSGRLFDAARDWLAAQGLPRMRGPTNPSLNHECGLLIDGFHESPLFMMTYNHPYYQRLWDEYGFRKAHDLYAFGGHIDEIKRLDERLKFVVEEATRRFNIKCRKLDTSRMNEEVRTFLHIYNQALGGTWGFVPLSEAEIDHMAESMKFIIEPHLTVIGEIDGKAVGAIFALLDYNPLIKELDGGLFPLGFLSLLTQRKRLKRFRLLATTVLPEYQSWGVGIVILAQLKQPCYDWGLEEAEFSWVLESNYLSAQTLRRGGAKLTKTYRLYDYGPPAPPQDETSV